MFRTLSMILAVVIAACGASAANAGTHWSVEINVPVQRVWVPNGGYHVSGPARVYDAPVPVVRSVPRPVYFAPPVYVPSVPVYVDEPVVYEAPYRVAAYGAGYDLRGSHWERRRPFEHARWERARHEREERQWDRAGRRDGGRWQHD